MTPDELARIAVARYGPHGWKSKLAEYLGVDPKTVWRYRRGRTPIDDRTAMAIQALEIPVSNLKGTK